MLNFVRKGPFFHEPGLCTLKAADLGSFCIRDAAAETECALHVHFGYSMCTAPTVVHITDIFKREGWAWEAEVEKGIIIFYFRQNILIFFI